MTSLPKREEIITPKDGWKERTYYVVEVAFSKNNPKFKAIFYSGFLNGVDPTNKNHGNWPGGYATVHEGINAFPFQRVYYLRPICEILEMKD